MPSPVDVLFRNDIRVWHIICYTVDRLSKTTGFASIYRVNSVLTHLHLNFQWDTLLFQMGVLRYNEPSYRGAIELHPSLGRKYSDDFRQKASSIAPQALATLDEIIDLIKRQPSQAFGYHRGTTVSHRRRLLRAPRILLCDIGTEHNRLSGILPLLKQVPTYRAVYLLYNGGTSENSANISKLVFERENIALSAELVRTDVFDPDYSLRTIQKLLAEQDPLCVVDVVMIGMSRINIATTLAALKEYFRKFTNESGLFVETNWFWAEPIGYGDNPGEFDQMISSGPRSKRAHSLVIPSGFDAKRIMEVVADVRPDVCYVPTPSNPNQEEANKRSRQTANAIRSEFPNVLIHGGVDYSRPYSMYNLLQFYRPDVVSPLGSRPAGLAASI